MKIACEYNISRDERNKDMWLFLSSACAICNKNPLHETVLWNVAAVEYAAVEYKNDTYTAYASLVANVKR